MDRMTEDEYVKFQNKIIENLTKYNSVVLCAPPAWGKENVVNVVLNRSSIKNLHGSMIIYGEKNLETAKSKIIQEFNGYNQIIFILNDLKLGKKLEEDSAMKVVYMKKRVPSFFK